MKKFSIAIAAVLNLTMFVSVHADGIRVYEASGSGTNVVFDVDTATANPGNSVAMSISNAIADFEFANGVYYAPSTNNNTDLFILDAGNGNLLDTVTLLFPAGGDVITSVEYVGGTLYGGFTTEGGGSSSLVTIDPVTGDVIDIGAMGISSPTGGLAYDGSTMYTVNSAAGGAASLFTVDLGSGAATLVGTVNDVTGAPVALTGLEFGTDGVLYGLGKGPDADGLYSIDPGTGAAVFIGNLGLGSTTALTAVPEPGTLGFLGLAGILAAATRRRSR